MQRAYSARGDAPATPAVFHLSVEKRNTLDYALDHLHHIRFAFT